MAPSWAASGDSRSGLQVAAEIGLRTGFSEMQSAISALKRGQEILRDLHDKQELAEHPAEYKKYQGVDKDHVDLTRNVLEGEVLNPHSDYLCRRDRLRDTCMETERAASRSFRIGSTFGVGAAMVSGLVVIAAARARAS